MMHLVLYSTSACHLCEQAVAILQEFPSGTISWQEVEISDDERLLQRYGLRIPVLLRPNTQSELNWPFSQADVLLWIQEQGQSTKQKAGQ